LPYTWNGVPYSTAGTYIKTLVNAAGCDSVATLVLSIKATTNSTTSVSVCSNQLPYTWNGVSYSAAGTYIKTLVNAAGCDSVATLVLSIKATTSSTTNVSVCTNQLPYTWNGVPYSTAGTYIKTLVNAVGCDSVATLVLSIKATTSSTTNISVCNNQLPYTWNGVPYSSAGTYNKTLVNAAGCDSVATLVLSIKATTNSITSVSVCSNELPYEWNGVSYSVAGTYNLSISNNTDCDSIATLVLSVKNTTTSNTGVAICSSGLPYEWNGALYQLGGVFTQILSNAAGCDSIAKLYLDVTPAIEVFDITGGGNYQQGGPGVSIGLNGSTLGVNYQLMLNGLEIGSVIVGTGNPLDFGAQYTPGVYTIKGAPGSLCTAMMNGNATVVMTSNPPAVFTVTGGGS
jgi:hypothetical protein